MAFNAIEKQIVIMGGKGDQNVQILQELEIDQTYHIKNGTFFNSILIASQYAVQRGVWTNQYYQQRSIGPRISITDKTTIKQRIQWYCIDTDDIIK